jgi:hypothetical protein
MVCQTTTHRLALGSPYSKPSTATATVEDSLPHLAGRQCLAKLHFVSIAVAHTLCNAAIGLRIARRFTSWLLRVGRNPFERRDCAQHVASVRATLTADRLQQQERKHMPFKEPARTGAIGLVCATSSTVEFLEEPAPRGPGNGSHGTPTACDHFNPGQDAKLQGKGFGQRSGPSLTPPCPVRAALVNLPFLMVTCAVAGTVTL